MWEILYVELMLAKEECNSLNHRSLDITKDSILSESATKTQRATRTGTKGGKNGKEAVTYTLFSHSSRSAAHRELPDDTTNHFPALDPIPILGTWSKLLQPSIDNPFGYGLPKLDRELPSVTIGIPVADWFILRW